MELRYLYGSRQAWNTTGPTVIDAEALDWILQFADQASLRMVLSCVGVEPEEVASTRAQAGLPADRWQELLASEQVQAFAGFCPPGRSTTGS